jgi:hypothetical protein
MPRTSQSPCLIATKVFGEECHSCASSCREFCVISDSLSFLGQNIFLILFSKTLRFEPKIINCITTICFVVWYGCETWYFTLRKEHRLRVFENRVLREVFGPKREQVTREWRRLRNGELHDMYRSPNIIRAIKSRRM